MRFSTGLFTLTGLGLLGCSASSSPASNADTALEALQTVYGDKDLGAVDRYFDPTFIRHDPAASADGTAAFKADIAATLPALDWQAYRTYQDGDFVVVHDEYDNLTAAGSRSISFDLFRFGNGKIVEHWTCAQSDPGTYVSGRTMVDGPTELDPTADTLASKDVVVTPDKGFVPVVIIGGMLQQLPTYLVPNFAQHDPLIGDGLAGLQVGFSQPPLSTIRAYSIPESVGENDFVFTRSKGTLTWDAQKVNSPDNPTVYCDLFHVQAGMITEHWDVIQLDPNSTDINAPQPNRAGHTMWE